MLFFTQCFGAVLDLIHLRFQHYKAKRVFSAAGQLVCVVNPTHNLKVSCYHFLFPRLGFQSFLPAGLVGDPPRVLLELLAKALWLALVRAWYPEGLPRLLLAF